VKNPASSALIVLALAGFASAQTDSSRGGPGGPPQERLDWRQQETILSSHIQLTSRDEFLKAGEAYFSADGKWVIFQATPAPAADDAADPFYSMYVAKVEHDGRGRIAGLGESILISPAGSANTCGWFHPTEPWRVLFGSTIHAPDTDQRAGFQVGTRKYEWMFPEETEVVEHVVPEIWRDYGNAEAIAGEPLKPLFSRPRYDAEGSYSPCGRFVLYAHVREQDTAGRADADIWIYDTKTQQHHEIVSADGYDGGPFFSPDGKRICYRSDRKLNNQLQLYIADLKFDESGAPTGIEREYQITDNEHVNWAPFWHPSGAFIVYGSSEVGHWNYEVFAVEIDESRLKHAAAQQAEAGATILIPLRTARITYAGGADVLPVFSADGSKMMWTAQRGPMAEGEQRPSSQLWVAEFDAGKLKFE
jgi:TolB protein